jgi:hypothetical protein
VSFGKENLQDESWASSHGLNKFQESQNTPKPRLQHSQTSRLKNTKKWPWKSNKKEKSEKKRMNSRFQPTSWLNNHEIFFTRPGLASYLHPPTRDGKLEQVVLICLDLLLISLTRSTWLAVHGPSFGSQSLDSSLQVYPSPLLAHRARSPHPSPLPSTVSRSTPTHHEAKRHVAHIIHSRYG